MNKLYITALAVALVGSSAFAQRTLDGNFPYKRDNSSVEVQPDRRVSNGADRAVIWSDDFSIPANWVAGVINDPNNQNWVIGTDGPSGAFAIADILSTTAANGFALYDSDLMCDGPQNAYLQMASPVDLSASSGVVLTFEQYYRKFQGMCWIDVSTNGTDWIETEINGQLAVNAATTNPHLFTLNITAMAGGQATVWVRFRYTGDCDYAWMVDDVSIIDLPEDDLIMNYSFMSTTGTGEEYGRIPTSQLGTTMNVGAEIENFGSVDQTNVTVVMEVRDAASALAFSQTTVLGTILAGGFGMMDEIVTLPSLPQGVYTGTFTVSSDQSANDANPLDNVFLRTFMVNDQIFSLDGIGNHPPGYQALTSLGSNSFDGDSQGLKLLNYYEVRSELEVNGIQIVLANGTLAGSYVFVSIYDTTTVFDDNFASLLNQTVATTDDAYTITAADISGGGVVNISFPSAVTLAPGGYYAAVTLYQDGDNIVRVLDDITVPQPNNAGLIYSPSDAVTYGNGNAHAVRFVSNPTISVGEVAELEGVTVYPNPTNGVLRINSEKFEKYTVEVMNVVGELVMTTSFSGSTTLDLTGNAHGLYNVRISNGTKSTVKRVTLN